MPTETHKHFSRKVFGFDVRVDVFKLSSTVRGATKQLQIIHRSMICVFDTIFWCFHREHLKIKL